jgi:hypothetical protein
MTRLGLQLTLRSGREAAARLILTTVAVAIGVTVLLAVLADYHAYQVTSRRPSWESTQPMRGGGGSTSNVELWNYSENIYQGRFIEDLGVAALGPKAPVVPGIPRLPKSGEFYASPALATLLATVPRDELGARFPGRQVGVIGRQALTGPQELVAIVGYDPSTLAGRANTIRVDHISTAVQLQGTTQIYRLAFGLGAIAVLFPLLILIVTATRLSAARREERYAAIRLVGGTPGQIDVIASVDAVVAAVLGTLLGIAVFLLVRPVLADVSLSGARFFPEYVTPTLGGYVAMLFLVPIGSAVASLLSLRRVQVTPLGVARKTTPRPPGAWRLLPLAVGIPLFVVPIVRIGRNPERATPGPAFLGLLLILAGLILAGPWLTMQASLVTSRLSRGASSLLAARRLGDNPRASFRSVSGLVLAVFVATGIAVLAPAVDRAQSPPGRASLANVLRVPSNPKFAQLVTGGLIAGLNSFPVATVIPIYANPGPGSSVRVGPTSGGLPPDSILPCAALRELPALGTCPPGATAVLANAVNILFTDNPLEIYKDLPLATTSSPQVSGSLTGLPLSSLLVKTNDPATLERVRTYITRFEDSLPSTGPENRKLAQQDLPPIPLDAWQMGEVEPETFGEMSRIRNDDVNNLERVVLVALGLTLLVAGCSLAVSVGGSLVERKRPFTLLRVSGTSTGVLRGVVLLEAGLPLLVTSLVAAVTGALIAVPVVRALLPKTAHVAYPGPIYYMTMGLGLLVSIAVILATLPLLDRITRTENARFE